MNANTYIGNGGDHLDLLLATSEIGIWELDVITGLAKRNLRHDQIFGHAELLDLWSADIFLTYVVEEERDRIKILLENAVAEGKPWSFETRIRRIDGAHRWISAKGTPKFSETGEMTKLIGHVIDITDVKENEERLRLLSKELNHRVSNTITILSSIVRHSAKSSTTPSELADLLTARLESFARSNRVLTASDAERKSLADIIAMEVEVFEAWKSRVEVHGDTAVWCSARASEGLTLIFHELLTNAVKHGSLSSPDGRVDIDITNQNDGAIRIRWRESGGPTLKPPDTQGIGTSILNSALRDQGRLEISYTTGGLECDITVQEAFRHPAVTTDPTGRSDPTMVKLRPLNSLKGKRILVVEDDPIIGFDLAATLRDNGMSVIGPYASENSAIPAIDAGVDAALVDVNLGRETSAAVATQLSKMGIPFGIVTGQSNPADFGEVFAGKEIIQKPYRERHVLEMLAKLCAS